MESFQIPGWGGGWGSLSKWECNRAFPVKNKGNESYKEPKEAISTRNISICRNGGRLRSLGLVKKVFYLFFVSFLSIPRNAFFVPREAFVVLEFVFSTPVYYVANFLLFTVIHKSNESQCTQLITCLRSVRSVVFNSRISPTIPVKP